jgi:hypothetical protein
MVSAIIKGEGHQQFDPFWDTFSRATPSPLDPIRATRLAIAAIDLLDEHCWPFLPIIHHIERVNIRLFQYGWYPWQQGQLHQRGGIVEGNRLEEL